LLKADLPVPLDVIVVDDGSNDGGTEEISKLLDEGTVRVLRHSVNRGKGAAIRTGLKQATGDVVAIYDADLEYNPDNYRELLRPIFDGEATVVYGTRSWGAHTAYSFWYVLGNKLVSFFASFLFNSWLSDIYTCFKLAPVEVWRSLELSENKFGIEAEFTGKVLKAGHRIYELPIEYRSRSRAEGKKLRWTAGLRAAWVLLRVRLFWRPG
jgi:glycosyltransferase involved in cell wall biosynthesis